MERNLVVFPVTEQRPVRQAVADFLDQPACNLISFRGEEKLPNKKRASVPEWIL